MERIHKLDRDLRQTKMLSSQSGRITRNKYRLCKKYLQDPIECEKCNREYCLKCFDGCCNNHQCKCLIS